MTVNGDAVRQKLQLLESYVKHLQIYRARTAQEMRADMGLAWTVEHGLQLSIQCVIDVCHYLVASLALGTPATSQEAIEILRDAGVFSRPLAQTLIQMARFRNILVHVYAQVDVERVHENLQNHLDDFGQFAAQVLSFLSRQQQGASSSEGAPSVGHE